MGGSLPAPVMLTVCPFSILLRIDLVFGEGQAQALAEAQTAFQYPLADRLGFWGADGAGEPGVGAAFSILLRIDLVFGGQVQREALHGRLRLSVSSCGSTWFLG